MPKLKTHSGTKDRIRINKNGKVLRRKATGNHLLQKKSKSRKRTLAGVKVLTGKQAKNVKLNLGA
ncbi:MAG TPA: 50S ribosomal protein L35 [Candidatus Saccharibacteria bacterium]|jgi:large subunit ribosomal protein L35|nr:50S ribosomal protein L35 [Candidatus Saccharibacteria bacterium]HMT56037.1 50S ribosomal protein L35 [Candidatus Saccharibacteria bacterium]